MPLSTGAALSLTKASPCDSRLGRNIHAVTPTTQSSGTAMRDRKSTRLNSSHSQISYAVFCLKKKNTPVHNSISPLPPDCAHPRCAVPTRLADITDTSVLYESFVLCQRSDLFHCACASLSFTT